MQYFQKQTGNREGENMKAHSSKVLALINYRKYAFSSSFDKSIIVWDCSVEFFLSLNYKFETQIPN